MFSILDFCLFWHLINWNMCSTSCRCLFTIAVRFNFMAAVSNPLSGVHSLWQTVISDGTSLRWRPCLRPVSIIDLWTAFTTFRLEQIWSNGTDLSSIRISAHSLAKDLGLGWIRATKWFTIALPTTQTLSTNGSFLRAASILEENSY